MHHSVRTDGSTRYVCGKSPGADRCGRIAVTAEPLEEFITEAVLSTIEDGALTKALSSAEKGGTGDIAKELRANELRLEQLARDHYVEGSITKAEFLAARSALLERMEAQRSRIAETTNQSILTRLPGASASLRKAWQEGDVDWRRAVISAVLDHAVINPGRPGRRKFDTDRVELVWRA